MQGAAGIDKKDADDVSVEEVGDDADDVDEVAVNFDSHLA